MVRNWHAAKLETLGTVDGGKNGGFAEYFDRTLTPGVPMSSLVVVR